MGWPFHKSKTFHASERDERAQRWANECEKTRKPEPSDLNYDEQMKRHIDAKEYYKEMLDHGFEMNPSVLEDFENRPSVEDMKRQWAPLIRARTERLRAGQPTLLFSVPVSNSFLPEEEKKEPSQTESCKVM